MRGPAATANSFLRNIPPGQGYQLIAIHSSEYLPAQYAQPAPGLPGLPLTLSSGQQLSNVRIALWPAAQVSGRVLDRMGRPVKAIVTAFKPWYMETWRVLARTQDQSKTGVVARVETNDRGEYRFQGLPAGQYYFNATSTSSIQIGNVKGYTFSSYYGASGPADEADPVDLNLGETVSDLNIVGDLMLRSTIQGQAIDRRTGDPRSSDANTHSSPRRDTRGSDGIRSGSRRLFGSGRLHAFSPSRRLCADCACPRHVRQSQPGCLRIRMP